MQVGSFNFQMPILTPNNRVLPITGNFSKQLNEDTVHFGGKTGNVEKARSAKKPRFPYVVVTLLLASGLGTIIVGNTDLNVLSFPVLENIHEPPNTLDQVTGVFIIEENGKSISAITPDGQSYRSSLDQLPPSLLKTFKKALKNAPPSSACQITSGKKALDAFPYDKKLLKDTEGKRVRKDRLYISHNLKLYPTESLIKQVHQALKEEKPTLLVEGQTASPRWRMYGKPKDFKDLLSELDEKKVLAILNCPLDAV